MEILKLCLAGFVFVMAAAEAGDSQTSDSASENQGNIAPKPLYRDPVYDGAADPVLCWNYQENKWFMFYTNRRANVPDLPGVSWVHGTRIGIAESGDGGITWSYRGTAEIDYGQGEYSYWAPDVFYHEGLYHMYLTFVPGMHTDWSGTRGILHFTSKNLLKWTYQSTLELSSDRVIDACVFQLPNGFWRMWYNNEKDKKSIYYAESEDLFTWRDKGKAIGDQSGEGPAAFYWNHYIWMLVDNWRGLGVYRSADGITWTRQKENLLESPGIGRDDQVKGGHPGVVVSGNRAYLFYFTHPGRKGPDAEKDTAEQRRSSIQVVELIYRDGTLVCDRDKPTYIQLKPQSVSQEKMQTVYEEVKTPYKYGIVIQPPKNTLVDCPTVFQYQDKWYMVYIQFEDNQQGYTTHLAQSENLLDWKPLGVILQRGKTGDWDSAQAAGGIALCNYIWEGDYTPGIYDGKYWMSYLGGAKAGYETPPLFIGMAWTENPGQTKCWQRLSEPVLKPTDSDCRSFEKETLFKSHIICDGQKTLGSPFVMFYNARSLKCSERIGIAVSDDMTHWRRYGLTHILANESSSGHSGISGDPQIAKMGDLWVMFYFGAFWKPGAFDTFACSYDLINWTKWTGPDLIRPSETWDQTFAHKPWILKHHGIVYHFYCAVGDQGRAIALATSKELRKKEDQSVASDKLKP